MLGEHLQGDDAVVLGVEGAVDLAHPAAAQQALDAIGAELFELHPDPSVCRRPALSPSLRQMRSCANSRDVGAPDQRLGRRALPFVTKWTPPRLVHGTEPACRAPSGIRSAMRSLRCGLPGRVQPDEEMEEIR